MKDETAKPHNEALEPCCESCKHQIEAEPHKALRIKERCLFETKVTEYQSDGPLSWD